MTDSKALIERLREENEWTNQRPYFHAHGKCLEAADYIEKLEADISQLQVDSEPSPYCPICGSCGEEGCCGAKRCQYPDTGLTERIAELEADNARLRKAGNELGGYAGHDDSCACVKGWATGPCNCGYTNTWNQWTAALQETSHEQE